MIQCGIYARISYDKTGAQAGVSTQVEDGRDLASRLDWVVAQEFAENDTSAYRKRRVVIDGQVRYRVVRPVFAEMLAAARSGQIQAVVVYDLDRMARDPRDLEDLIELVEHCGIQVRSVTGSLNLSSDGDVTMARVLVAMANKSSRDTSRRVSRAAKRNAESGRWRGKRCTGYTKAGELVPAEAEAIRDATQAVIAGSSLWQICERWDDAGLHRLDGGQWRKQPTKMRDVLVSYRIAGVPVYRGEPLFDVKATWPAIVTREDLEEVRAILLAPERRTNNRRAARRSLLSGLAICGDCGAPLRSSTHEGSRRKDPQRRVNRVQIYRCSGVKCGLLVRAWLADEPVVEAVITALLTLDLAALAPDETDRSRMASLRDELRHVEKGQEEIGILIAEGSLPLASARSSLEQLSARQRAAQGELRALSARFGPAQFLAASRDLLDLSDQERDARASDVIERFHALDLGHRRSIISSLVTVKVHRGHGGDRVVVRSRASGRRL